MRINEQCRLQFTHRPFPLKTREKSTLQHSLFSLCSPKSTNNVVSATLIVPSILIVSTALIISPTSTLVCPSSSRSRSNAFCHTSSSRSAVNHVPRPTTASHTSFSRSSNHAVSRPSFFFHSSISKAAGNFVSQPLFPSKPSTKPTFKSLFKPS